MKRIIRMFLLFLTISFATAFGGILTVASEQLFNALTGIVSAAAQTISPTYKTPHQQREERRAKEEAERKKKEQEKKNNEAKEKTKRGKEKAANDKLKRKLKRRAYQTVARNTVELGISWIPFIGYMASLGAVAADIKQACDTLNDLQEVELASISKKEKEEENRYCGLTSKQIKRKLR